MGKAHTLSVDGHVATGDGGVRQTGYAAESDQNVIRTDTIDAVRDEHVDAAASFTSEPPRPE